MVLGNLKLKHLRWNFKIALSKKKSTE